MGLAQLPGATLEKNRIPRIVSGDFTGLKQRLYWAHRSAVEVVAPFAASVIVAHSLVLSFVGFRIAHGLAYAANPGILMTLMFAGAFVCMLALFVHAA